MPKPRVKAQPKELTVKDLPASIQNQINNVMVQNGLQEVILGFNPGGIGQPISQVDTIFVNMRWYLISNMRQPLNQAYVEIGVIKTVIDVPVNDAFRGGIKVQSNELDPDELEEIETIMDREDIIHTFAQACKWVRLFGGGGILIITEQDYMSELNLEAIKEDSVLEFRAVDMWELFWDKQNTEGFDPTLQQHDYEYYSYYGIKVHKSRVIKLVGDEAPSFIRPRLRGWGLSKVEILVRSVNQFLKSTDLAFEVLDEFKLDIFKIKNLVNSLVTQEGTAQIQRRIQLANRQKNYMNALTMDSEDDYIQKQLSFGGLGEVMEGIRTQISCDLRMPQSKIWGTGSSGFSSGQDDIENYNAMVESEVRAKIKYPALRVIELLCQKYHGYIPEDLSIDFESLRVLSSVDEEAVKTSKFARLILALDKGAISPKDFKDAVNKDNLLPVKLDDSDDLLPRPDAAEEGAGAPEQNKGTSANPGPKQPKEPKVAKDPKTK